MTTYLAITRADVADYVDTLVIVYLVLIFIRILTSWVPRMPYNRFLAAFLQFISDVTDPYLNLFRRFIPMVRMGPGALDLSPIVATIVLIVVGGDRGRASSAAGEPGRPGSGDRDRRAGRRDRPGDQADRGLRHRAGPQRERVLRPRPDEHAQHRRRVRRPRGSRPHRGHPDRAVARAA